MTIPIVEIMGSCISSSPKHSSNSTAGEEMRRISLMNKLRQDKFYQHQQQLNAARTTSKGVGLGISMIMQQAGVLGGCGPPSGFVDLPTLRAQMRKAKAEGRTVTILNGFVYIDYQLKAQIPPNCDLEFFKRWAEYVRQQKIEEEILRQRMEQVTRLRSKLVRERALRDQVDVLTDEDMEKLIGYLNSGHSLSTVGHGGYGGSGRIDSSMVKGYQGGNRSANRLSKKVPSSEPKSDEFIFNEIRDFYAAHKSLKELHDAEFGPFSYNRRQINLKVEAAKPKHSKLADFVYNRRFN